MATDKKMKKILFDAGISRVIGWLEKKSWSLDIDYCNKDEMQPEERQITINARQGVEKQLYSLLHECGHIQQNWKRYEQDYPATAKMNCYASTNRRFAKSPKYKVDILAEEIEAWRRGKTLADRLGIYINEEKYNELTAECVYSYILWAAR